MADERFITLAIHTYDHAVTLRKILERHGMEVRFEKLVISGSGITSGIRVKINEHDLPLALRIMESADAGPVSGIEMKMAGTKGNVLIPVDFSSYSMMECRIGFSLAAQLKLHPVVMHAYATPYFNGSLAYADPLDIDPVSASEPAVAGMELEVDMKKECERLMRNFRKKLQEAQKNGELTDIPFTTTVSEGVAEDVIREYCRLTPPVIVVMATRGKDKKEEELVGSVTAEVLDSCRVPVLAVPENCTITDFTRVRKLIYFCNIDHQDIISVDTLMRLYDYPEVEVVLIPVNDRAADRLREKVDMLRDYFNKSYPAAHFISEVFPRRGFREELENYLGQTGAELLIVPNKKKNIFSRLFNPGMAHKLLFERDMPLLALPV